tara:strand:+ start:9189 stop:10856 length:1668 start_codon:yes stop_codon:yes gene_type:complete
MIVTRMPDHRTIYLAWRDEDGNRQTRVDMEFAPYFFIEDDSREPSRYKLPRGLYGSFRYEEGEYYNLQGKKLKKVIVEKSIDIRYAKEKFEKTYEADVPYHYRYCIDEMDSIPEYKLRKWYWDMEWQQGGAYNEAITTIVAYDNYDEVFYQWWWTPEEIEYENDEDNVITYSFENEKEMLTHFVEEVSNLDPDMLIAWFGLKFDLPVLLRRCAANGVDARSLSPIRSVRGFHGTSGGFQCSIGEEGFRDIEQPIGGRITLNLDLAFERQWNDSQRGTLPSMSLEYIGQTLFGEGKKKESKFQDRSEFFRRGWLEDTQNYMEYAVQDVELLRRIDETNFTSEAILAIQRLIIAPFDACFFVSHMGQIYFCRNADWKTHTGTKIAKEDRVSYDGALIYDPLTEGTNGRYENVAAFDFAGLYPSMMIARNISWETKSLEPTEFAVNIYTPRDFSEGVAKEMMYYKTDKMGLLPRAVLELKELRNEYKRKMRAARDSGDKMEYVKWNNNQMAVKRLMASFYGVVAKQGFGWADVDLAASITASAREAIREAAFKVRSMT